MNKTEQSETKKCCMCNEVKATSEFWKRSSRASGISSSCKVCQTSARNARSIKWLENVGKYKCEGCNILLVESNWYRDQWRMCRKCRVLIGKAKRHADPVAARLAGRIRANRWMAKQPPEYKRDIQLRHKYGISYKEYLSMLQAQGGVCCICKGAGRITTHLLSPLQVDHNHKTGKVRRLLCQPCNTALGKIREDVEVLDRMRSYILERA